MCDRSIRSAAGQDCAEAEPRDGVVTSVDVHAVAKPVVIGRGLFSLVLHVARKSGTIYETPIIVAPAPDGFVAALNNSALLRHERASAVRNAAGCDDKHLDAAPAHHDQERPDRDTPGRPPATYRPSAHLVEVCAV
jgi:hypothetical protein